MKFHIRYIENGYMVGAYYNSVENISTYAGYRWEYEDFGLEAAVVLLDIPQILFQVYVELTKISLASQWREELLVQL